MFHYLAIYHYGWFYYRSREDEGGDQCLSQQGSSKKKDFNAAVTDTNAGLQILYVNEHTAVTITYRLDKKYKSESRIITGTQYASLLMLLELTHGSESPLP